MGKTTVKITTEKELRSINLPEETKSYKPVPHGMLIDVTRQGISEAGFTIEKESYTSAANGMVANGKYTISTIKDAEMQIQIVWQNSYNKSMSLKWAIGVHVFICGNGCVSGDMGAFKRKHTGDVQDFTPKSIAEYLKTASEVFTDIQTIRERMKKVEVTEIESAEMLGRLYILENVMGSKQLNIIKAELDRPSYDYGAPNTLWELYNYVTYALKTIHPTDWMRSHEKTHQFFLQFLPEIIEEEDSPHKQLDWTEEVENMRLESEEG